MLLAGCLCLSVMLASCGKRTDVGKEDPFIYCLNEDRTGLTKISYDFPEGNAEETARAVLEELKEPAEEHRPVRSGHKGDCVADARGKLRDGHIGAADESVQGGNEGRRRVRRSHGTEKMLDDDRQQSAERRGEKEIADEFYRRSQNYRNVFNPETSFMQPRDSKGNFIPNYDPEAYIEDICESNGWQYYWSVAHDINGLIELTGGEARFAERLDSMFTYETADKSKLPIFSTGMIGQYAHGNEPGHHVIYLYNRVKQPWKTQQYAAQVMHTLYKNTPDGICGNEDCGQMSSWYVFSAMGFYPVDPISGQYEIGSPIFPEVKMYLANGKTFVVRAENVSDENIYIQSVTVNGQPYNKSYITHEMIMQGDTIHFVMGNKPGPVWYE